MSVEDPVWRVRERGRSRPVWNWRRNRAASELVRKADERFSPCESTDSESESGELARGCR